jgi:site-specific recombinase XerC
VASAREAVSLPSDLVLYCARHDYGSFVLSKTGNLKEVMNAVGHGDVTSAMVYQPTGRSSARLFKCTPHFTAHRRKR